MAIETLHVSEKPAPETITVSPMTLHIGAEIGGVDLSQPLGDQQRNEIWDAFVRWKVLIFRDQDLDKASFVAASRRFGPLTRGHNIHNVDPDFPEIYGVVKGRQKTRLSGEPIFQPWTGWHTDLTPAINPPTGSFLWGLVVPPYGGDTQFTNLVAAYETLSPTMQEFVNTLRGVHTYLNYPGIKPTADFLERIAKNEKTSEHPIVRVHPDSGERILFVSPKFLRDIAGMTPTESEAILALLKAHVARPEFTVRVRWAPNSVVMWDNRATAHIAPRDINKSDFDRQLFRTTLVGEIPVGVDGRQSTPIAGTPLLAA
jgi:alpha-ketoglutarate-dependent taurine dioxygenase